MQPFQKEHRNQSCPNLDVNGIGTGSDEAFDFQVLFEREGPEVLDQSEVPTERNLTKLFPDAQSEMRQNVGFLYTTAVAVSCR